MRSEEDTAYEVAVAPRKGGEVLQERLQAHTPLRSAADPDEIAQAAAWLLSDCSSFVTGTVLRVDGGARA